MLDDFVIRRPGGTGHEQTRAAALAALREIVREPPTHQNASIAVPLARACGLFDFVVLEILEQSDERTNAKFIIEFLRERLEDFARQK